MEIPSSSDQHETQIELTNRWLHHGQREVGNLLEADPEYCERARALGPHPMLHLLDQGLVQGG